MNPTDPNTLLPCPFCGDEMRITAFGSVRHSLEREHTCYIGDTVFPLAKWNTRAPSELTQAQAETAAMRAERDEAVRHIQLAGNYHAEVAKSLSPRTTENTKPQ